MILEVDGASHQTDERANKDRIRDAVFAQEGFRTLRSDNAMIRDNLGDMVEFIRRTLVEHPTRSPLRFDHPPHEGEVE